MRFLTLFLRRDVMSKKLHLLISFVSVLIWASIIYGQADPRMIKLDLNNTADNNEPNTQVGFTPFILENSGSEVNGVVIDLSGNLNSARRNDPHGVWAGDPPVYYPRAGERIYRDFIYGVWPSGVTITLYGLGVNRDCNITIWAYDDNSTEGGNRIANWYANGIHILDTNFIGGYWPCYDCPEGLYLWAFSGRATTDYLGKIILTSYRDPESPAGLPFAFVNALIVEPNVSIPFVETNYAQHPQPVDGEQNVPVNTLLKWRKGGLAEKRDVYLGIDEAKVTDANRTNPLGVLLSQNQDGNIIDPYGATGFLKLDKIYYWRVDEVNTTPPPTSFYKGEVWSFTTSPYSVVDDFESYIGTEALKAIWPDYWTNGTCAEVFLETTEYGGGIVHSGSQSMRYEYKNYTYWPYYSEANATVADLGIDPNWLGMDAKSLSLWFYGKLTNDANEEMYIKLVDSDTPVNTATVFYGDYGDMNDVRERKWNEWNIPLADFTAVNPSFNLRKVANIIIGFGDGTPAFSDGTVYFDDIRLYATRCVLAERAPDFAMVDYAPIDAAGFPIGDCVVDYKELAIMADTWLHRWSYPYPPTPLWPPSIPNLVVYWPMNEGYGDKIYPEPYDPDWIGTFSPSGVSWVMPGAWDSDAALHFSGDYGGRVSCGNQNPASEANEITLALCAKWLGPRTWDSYLLGKSQGLISKRNGWSPTSVQFMFEISPGYSGSFALRSYAEPPIHLDLYSPPGILNPYIGSWVHLAATFDGTTAKLYLNGNEVASGPFSFSGGTDAILTLGCTMDINAWPGKCPETYYGDMDEVCIYNRALTADEIEYLAYYYKPRPIANLYNDCWWWEWECPQEINFKDFAVLANYWLEEDMFP
jgi:hypothetical protein